MLGGWSDRRVWHREGLGLFGSRGNGRRSGERLCLGKYVEHDLHQTGDLINVLNGNVLLFHKLSAKPEKVAIDLLQGLLD